MLSKLFKFLEKRLVKALESNVKIKIVADLIYLKAYYIFYFSKAAVIKHCRRGGLNRRHLISHRFGSWKTLDQCQIIIKNKNCIGEK